MTQDHSATSVLCWQLFEWFHKKVLSCFRMSSQLSKTRRQTQLNNATVICSQRSSQWPILSHINGISQYNTVQDWLQSRSLSMSTVCSNPLIRGSQTCWATPLYVFQHWTYALLTMLKPFNEFYNGLKIHFYSCVATCSVEEYVNMQTLVSMHGQN